MFCRKENLASDGMWDACLVFKVLSWTELRSVSCSGDRLRLVFSWLLWNFGRILQDAHFQGLQEALREVAWTVLKLWGDLLASWVQEVPEKIPDGIRHVSKITVLNSARCVWEDWRFFLWTFLGSFLRLVQFLVKFLRKFPPGDCDWRSMPRVLLGPFHRFWCVTKRSNGFSWGDFNLIDFLWMPCFCTRWCSSGLFWGNLLELLQRSQEKVRRRCSSQGLEGSQAYLPHSYALHHRSE